MNESRRVSALATLLVIALIAIITLGIRCNKLDAECDELTNVISDLDSKVAVLTLPIFSVTNSSNATFYVRAFDKFDAQRYYRAQHPHGDMNINGDAITIIGCNIDAPVEE